MKKQSRKQRIEKRQAHAEAYKQGFDDGFVLGYGVAVRECGDEDKEESDVLPLDCSGLILQSDDENK